MFKKRYFDWFYTIKNVDKQDTKQLYVTYWSWCIKNKFKPMAHKHFSACINNIFGTTSEVYQMIKINGKQVNGRRYENGR